MWYRRKPRNEPTRVGLNYAVGYKVYTKYIMRKLFIKADKPTKDEVIKLHSFLSHLQNDITLLPYNSHQNILYNVGTCINQVHY